MINGGLIEEWRDTYVYGEQYEVSNMGMVRNKTTKHILSPQTDNKGYLRVRLSMNDKKSDRQSASACSKSFYPESGK